MLKRSVCAFLSLLTLLFCTVFLSCNFSEPNEVSTVSFVVNCDQLLSRNTASRSPDGLDSVKLVIALRGDYNDSQEVVFNPSTNKAEVSFKNIPVGSSVQALCCMTLDAYLMYVGYSDSATLKKGENTISLKLIRPLNESILTSQAFALSQAENDDNMYILYTFKLEDSAAGSGNWIIYDVIKERVFSFGLYNNLSKNTDQTVKSLSVTEYIYDGSNLGYQIVSTPKAQTITPSENSFKFISENGKELTFRVSGYIEAEETEASGTIEFPITADSFNISFDETKSSEGLYRNYYKIALKATDKDGNEITDDITWNAKLLYGGKDINTAVVVDTVPMAYYAFDPETATLTPAVTVEGLYKILATSGPYQLYVTAEYGDNSYSSLMTIKIPEEYYYEVSADDPDLLEYVFSELENIKTTVNVKLTGTWNDNLISPLFSSINCASHLDLSDSGLTAIGDGLFSDSAEFPDRAFLSIKLPKGLISIGNYAFRQCPGLAEITIPDTVTTIGEYAFNKCPFIKIIELPESVESLGEYAFSEMGSLASIVLPSKITEIPDYLFKEDPVLTEVEILGDITTIGSSPFYRCPNLTSFVIPASVETIGSYAFYGCSELQEVIFEEGSVLKTIGSSAFGETKIQTISFPDSLKTIDNSAFTIKTLTSVNFGNGLEKIGEFAFVNSKLQHIEFPDSLIIIDNEAFKGVSTLNSVTFGSNLKAIGPKAFFGTQLNGTDGTVSGIPSGAWYSFAPSDTNPGGPNTAWSNIKDYYSTVPPTGTLEVSVSKTELNLNQSYDFSTADLFMYIQP